MFDAFRVTTSIFNKAVSLVESVGSAVKWYAAGMAGPVPAPAPVQAPAAPAPVQAPAQAAGFYVPKPKIVI